MSHSLAGQGPALGWTLLQETQRGLEGCFWALGGLYFLIGWACQPPGTQRLQTYTRHWKLLRQ